MRRRALEPGDGPGPGGQGPPSGYLQCGPRLPLTVGPPLVARPWRDRPAAQQPDWPDAGALEAALDELRAPAPARVRGRGAQPAPTPSATWPRGGPSCCRPATAPSRSTVLGRRHPRQAKVILQMAVVLTYGSGVPAVKVGRIAGQFAKPRSSDTSPRRRRAAVVPRPHRQRLAVRRRGPRPDPDRLSHGYHQSAATLNLLRAFTKGGFADLSRCTPGTWSSWPSTPEGRRYEALADEIDAALRFMAACGIDLEPSRSCTRSTSTRRTRR